MESELQQGRVIAAGEASGPSLLPTTSAQPGRLLSSATQQQTTRSEDELNKKRHLINQIIKESQEIETMPPRRPRVLLAASGSVATIKLSLLAQSLLEFADVHIISTKSSLNFFNELDLPTECGPVLTDDDEWEQWKELGDPVVHIELRRWADLLVIAPLSANTLAKIANGFCDNLLTCVVRAWDVKKPMLVAPAMNTFMWKSPFTSQHIESLKRLGIEVIPPVEKRLACGDVGAGGMASLDTITSAVKHLVNPRM